MFITQPELLYWKSRLSLLQSAADIFFSCVFGFVDFYLLRSPLKKKSNEMKRRFFRNRFFWRQINCVRDYAKSLSRFYFAPLANSLRANVCVWLEWSERCDKTIKLKRLRKVKSETRVWFDYKPPTSGSRVWFIQTSRHVQSSYLYVCVKPQKLLGYWHRFDFQELQTFAIWLTILKTSDCLSFVLDACTAMQTNRSLSKASDGIVTGT